MKIEVQHVEYHRNGISGEGFYSVSFQWKDDRGEMSNMLGVVFDYEEHERNPGEFYNCRTAVLDRDHLVPEGESDGPFGINGIPCWRGDHFDAALREAIRNSIIAHNAKREREVAAMRER